MRKLVTFPNALPVNSGSGSLRQLWGRLVEVKFISQASEDEQLAEIERLAREQLEGGSAPCPFPPTRKRPRAFS